MIRNNETGESISIKVQSVANHGEFDADNTVVEDFEFKAYSDSSISQNKVLLLTNTTALSGTNIGPNGHEQDANGNEMPTERWLGHDGAPFSGGCIIPATDADFNAIKQFFSDQVPEGTTIPITLIQEPIPVGE